MRMTLEIYQERIDEIELYFNALKELYQTQSQESEHSFYNADFLKILKANALIMIYNLVESSIMGGILEIYDELKNSGYNYKDVRKEIQKGVLLTSFGRHSRQTFAVPAHPLRASRSGALTASLCSLPSGS